MGLFINDLASDVNSNWKGINVRGNLIVALLLYADDFTIFAASEEDLQDMLNMFDRWYKKWKIRVKKTKIVHFRTNSQ